MTATDIPARPNMFSESVPLLQIAWDATSLDALQRCPKYYEYSIIQGWRKNADTINFGLWFHNALEAYERAVIAGEESEDALALGIAHALAEAGVADPETGEVIWDSLDNRRTRWTLIRALVWWVDEWGDGAVQPYVFPDGTPAIELSFTIPLPLDNPDGNPYLLCGHLDGVVNFGATDRYIKERKTTTSTLSGFYFKRFAPNTQISTYDLAAEFVLPELGTKGVMMEAAQTGVTFARFARQFVNRTPAMREEWLRDMLTWIRHAEEYARESYWPQNQASCSNYGGCPYRGICSKDPASRKRFLESEFKRSWWDPTDQR